MKPINEPSQTLGIDSKQYRSKNTNTVGKEIVAAEFSNQFAKFIIMNIKKIRLGYAIDVSIVHRSQSFPWNIL